MLNNNYNVLNTTYNITRQQHTTHNNISTTRNMISDKGRLPQSFSWLGTGTLMKSGGIKLVLWVETLHLYEKKVIMEKKQVSRQM